MPNTFSYSDWLRSTQRSAGGLIRPLALYPTTRQDELSEYMPSQEEVMHEKEKQEGGVMSTIFKVLELPTIATGGYAIAGGIEAALKGEDVGEAVARGSPFAFISDWLGLSEDLFGEQAVARRKQFRDIRIASGTEEVDEGWYNTVVNIVGSIALDPSTYILPGGALKHIEKGAKKALVEHGMMWGMAEARASAYGSRAMEAVAVARAQAGHELVNSTRGLVMQSMMGDPRMAISMAEKAKASSMAFVVFNIPFTSLQFPIKLMPQTWRNRIAEHLTHAAITLNSNPITKPIVKAFGGIATAAENPLARETLKHAPEIRMNMQREIVMNTLNGLQNLQSVARKAGVVFDAETDKVLVDFIEHDVGMTDTVQDIVHKLTASGRLLDAAKSKNFSGRLKTILDDMGFPVPGGVKAGADLPNVRSEALIEATGQRMDRFGNFLNNMKDPASLDAYLKYTDGVKGLLKVLDVGEQRAGLMHATLEGYFPRVMTEEAKTLLDEMMPELIRKHYGSEGMSVIAPFLKNRKITDLTTLEINYIGHTIGFKATGYEPLSNFMGELAKKDKALWKKLKKADPEMVQWFTTDITAAMYDRARKSGEVVSKKVMLDYLFDPDNGVAELLKGATLEEVMKTNPGKVLVERLDGAGYKQLDRAQAIKEGFVGLDDSRRAAARQGVRVEIDMQLTALQGERDRVKKLFDDALNLGVNDPLDYVPGEIGLQMEKKTVLRGIKSTDLEIQRLAAIKNKNTAEVWRLQVMRESLKEQQTKLLEIGENLRYGIAQVTEQHNELRAGFKGHQEDTLGAINATTRAPGETAYEVAAIRSRSQALGVHVHRDLTAGLPQGTGKNLYLVDPEVADGIEQVLSLVHTKEPYNRLLSWFDRATDWWKRITVLPFPQSRARDLVSNLSMLALGGFRHPSAFGDASRISGAYQKFLKGEFETVEAAFSSIKIKVGAGMAPELAELAVDGTLDGLTVFKEARARGLIDAGYLRDEFQNSYVDMYRQARKNTPASTLNAMLNPIKALDFKPGTSFWVKTGSQVAEWGDNMTKLAGFSDALKRGMNLDEAASHVRKYIWSPGTTTYSSFEKYGLRRVMPFYNWTKHVVGTMTDQFFKKPGAFAAFQHIRQQAENSVGVEGFNEDVLAADIIHDRLGIPVKMTERGPAYLMFDGYLPHADVPALMQAFLGLMPYTKVPAKESLSFLGERLNPIIRTALEDALNYEFYSDRDIEHFDDEASEMFGIPMTKKNKKILSNIRFLKAVDSMNLVNLSDFQVKGGGDAVLRQGGKATTTPLPTHPSFEGVGEFFESVFTARGPTGEFGVLPKARRVDVEIEARRAATAAKRTIGEARSSIRKRLEDQRPTRKMDMDTLKSLIASKQAELLRINETATKFGINLFDEER